MSEPGHDPGDLILLGKITKPHGIRGEVKVYTFSEQPGNFRHYQEILLQGDGQGEWIPLKVIRARVQGKQVILQLAGCESRSEAENLAGREIRIHRRDLPPPADDEYYWADLEGRMAVSEDGRKLGRIKGIMATGAHDVISVTGEGHGEYLLPIGRDFIVRMNEFEVVLRVPPGLLDINRS